MADALRLAPWLLIAIAADPAVAEPQMPGLKLHPVEGSRLGEPARTRRDPVLGRHPFEDEGATLPSWGLPFGLGPGDRDRRGLSFSVRPHHGLKAMAKFRF
jgi:hypothetical protein